MTKQPLIAFYGDDFTGSSASLEVLAFAGLKSVLFLDVPSPDLLAKIGPVDAVGIAGVARSRPPSWMEAELPRMFDALQNFGARIIHYKTCSTFDSAPHIGSIGRAIEIGLDVTKASFAPLIVGAPAIGRYQVFGTLFAALHGVPFRLDRHPVMSRHPATPMHEADLLRHLNGQTMLPNAMVDWRTLVAGTGASALQEARGKGAKIIALDVFDDATLAAVGKVVWDEAKAAPVFAVGSQGVEYALVSHWQHIGLIANTFLRPPLPPASPLLALSGSCSDITAGQIKALVHHGADLIRLDATQALDPTHWQAAIDTTVRRARTSLTKGRSVVIATAEGPDDLAVSAFNAALSASHHAPADVHACIGAGLGQIAAIHRRETKLSRIVFCGGDTSGHAMLAVGAEALEVITSLHDGVPLLKVRSIDAHVDGLEVALKGGQMGDDMLLVRASTGAA